jgi:uncharacterized membrane protein
MKEYVHKHITSELQQNTKTDIIFILSAIFLNLIILAVNSGFANNQKNPDSSLLIMFLFVGLLVLLNLVVIFGLLKGKQTRSKLIKGLMEMYEDENVSKYYDASLLSNYNMRYNLFMMVVVLTGLVAIVVPFVMR